jgi:hypothetical protein
VPQSPRPNPFPQGTTTARRLFVGREAELSSLSAYVDSIFGDEHEAIPHLTGPLGIGKTALARELEESHRTKGWPTAYLEVGRGSLLARVTRRVHASVRTALGRRPGTAGARAAALLKRVSVSMAPASGVTLSVAGSPSPDYADEYEVLEALGDVIYEAAEVLAAPTLILFDESNLATASDGLTFIELRDYVRDRKLPLGFVLVGNYIGPLLGPRSYDARSFQAVSVGPLLDVDLRALLGSAVERLGGSWLDAALAETLAASEGNPFIAREIGNAAWRTASAQTITQNDVSRAVTAVRMKLGQGLHRQHWEAADDLGRELLVIFSRGDAEEIARVIGNARVHQGGPERASIHRLEASETVRVDWQRRHVELLVPWMTSFGDGLENPE